MVGPNHHLPSDLPLNLSEDFTIKYILLGEKTTNLLPESHTGKVCQIDYYLC